jgi:hypothetical protein
LAPVVNTQIVRDWFAGGAIDEILFVITYSAQTPPYLNS